MPELSKNPGRTTLEILRLLSEGKELRFTEIHSYLSKHYNLKKGTTSNHLENLIKKECISKTSRGVYVITEAGKSFLEYLELTVERRIERKAKQIRKLFSPLPKEFKILMIKGHFEKKIEIRSFLKELGWTGKEGITKITLEQFENVETPQYVWFETEQTYVFNFLEPPIVKQIIFFKDGETFVCFGVMVGSDKKEILDMEMKSESIHPVRYLVASLCPILMMIDGHVKKHATDKGLIVQTVAFSGSIERNYFIKEEEKPWDEYLTNFINLEGFKRVPKPPLKSRLDY